MNTNIDYAEYKQKLFEIRLDLLCEYKRLNPDKRVYLTENNLNMVYNKYKNLLGNTNLFDNN